MLTGGTEPSSERRISALPSPLARALAVAAIVGGGFVGALIGYAFVDIQCTGNCTTAGGIGALVGAASAAVGVAIVAVLTMRAMGEWKRVREADLFGEE